MPRILSVLFVALLSLPAFASHLSEAEVVAMENACQKLRQQKLAPEKAAVLQQCLAGGEKSESECKSEAAGYGEIQTGAIRRLGKYYDLPECQEAYRAREHFKINPGR
ncbi:MAG: hypothetical protein QNI86_12900 [Halieaceae bacterium]|nr:hypothetical protein [Halieaceae bacterium]